MAKFFGTIGYAVRVESKPGVYKDKVVEREYFGDLVKNTTRRYESSGGLNDNIIISNNISIIADAFALENFSNIKYVEFMGVRWIVSSVEIQHPRLLLSLGGVYNGKTS